MTLFALSKPTTFNLTTLFSTLGRLVFLFFFSRFLITGILVGRDQWNEWNARFGQSLPGSSRLAPHVFGFFFTLPYLNTGRRAGLSTAQLSSAHLASPKVR